MSAVGAAAGRGRAARWTVALLVCLSALVGVLVGVLGRTAPVWAHAELSSTSPEGGSILEEPPARVVLAFTEPVDAVDGSIRLVDPGGSDVEIGPVDQSLGADTLVAELPDLERGTYVVAWRAISSDSHPISGAFTFSVGIQTSTPAGLIDRLVAEDEPSEPAAVWLGIGRWASFAGIAVLLGVVAVLAVVAPAALAARRTTVVLVAGGAAALAGTAMMVLAQAVILGGAALDPASWADVAATRSGRWWVVRLALVALALSMVLTGRHRRRGVAGFGAPTTAVFALGATVLLAAVAAGGHAVTGRLVPVGFLATWVHLAAMSAWTGGLLAVALLVPRDEVHAVAARLSPAALVSVVALALTGVVNAWRQSDSIDALRESTYGRWLVVKLVVVALVVAVAGVTRWLVRQGAAPPSVGSAGARVDATGRAVRRAVRVEAAGIAVILAASAGLVHSPPARRSTPVEAVTVSAVEGDRIAQLVLDPPVTGGTTVHVYVTSTTGGLVRPLETTVSASLPAQGIDRLDLPLVEEAPGHLSGDDVVLPLAGTWTFTVEVRYGEFDSVRFELEAEVR